VRTGGGQGLGRHGDPGGAAAWRVLSDVPRDGPWNMAVDEAIALAVEAGQVAPTIRFYVWETPTVSLGCLQTAQRAVERAACERLGVKVVRRPTGGRAVLHDDELTYSVCVPLDRSWAGLSVGDSFCRIAEGLLMGLRRLGIAATLGAAGDAPSGSGGAEACFLMPRMPAVLVAGKKLIGSAQRRFGGAILQHGSLLLGANLAMHQAVFPGWPREDPGGGVTWLKALLPEVPTRPAIERAVMDGWEAALNIRAMLGELTTSEHRDAERLVAARYGTPAWTWRR
jgi:lipoyl(octanoyl) transferase